MNILRTRVTRVGLDRLISIVVAVCLSLTLAAGAGRADGEAWSELSTPNTGPGWNGYQAVYDPVNNRKILFSGAGCHSSPCPNSNVVVLDLTTNQWFFPTPSGPSSSLAATLRGGRGVETAIVWASGTTEKAGRFDDEPRWYSRPMKTGASSLGSLAEGLVDRHQLRLHFGVSIAPRTSTWWVASESFVSEKLTRTASP